MSAVNAILKAHLKDVNAKTAINNITIPGDVTNARKDNIGTRKLPLTDVLHARQVQHGITVKEYVIAENRKLGILKVTTVDVKIIKKAYYLKMIMVLRVLNVLIAVM